ncbi:MAG: HAD family hydrolase, partial [Candidatus Nanohaloarchaea archaeon]|nr:HAD family hydrolase [Candidatus Nanohaloarchaea archaeon]
NGTGKLQRAKLEKTGIADYIETVIISGEEGIRKPEQTFFEIAKERVDADQYVIVSHAPKRDIVPARKSGYSAVWLS